MNEGEYLAWFDALWERQTATKEGRDTMRYMMRQALGVQSDARRGPQYANRSLGELISEVLHERLD